MVLAVTVVCIWASIATGLARGADDSEEQRTFQVMAVGFEEFGESSAVLGELVVGVLAARGVHAHVGARSAACRVPDAAACLQRALAGLARGALAAAVLPAAAAPPAPLLRDAGLEELGDAAPPARRTCLATGGALRSLAELSDAARAAPYALPITDLRGALDSLAHPRHPPRYFCANGSTTMFPEPCHGEDYATVLTGDESEAEVMQNVVREHSLRAHVLAVGAATAPIAAALDRPTLICGRAILAQNIGAAATLLGPPACSRSECPFDARRLIKLVNVRQLAHSPSAIRAFGRLVLNETELRNLDVRAHQIGPKLAAREALTTHPSWVGASGEVRVAVMMPDTTSRQAYDAFALRAAAELAELDVADQTPHFAPQSAIEFKVELLDDGCAATRAFKYLTDALGTEFGALSGVVGPACGGAFGDVTRQSPALSLPVLAYTPQAPPTGEAAELTLLAAGDARVATDAWAALFAHMQWRRVAVLSELATRASLEVSRLSADVLVHVELPGDGDHLDGQLIVQWAKRVASVNGRIVYVCVEDARVVRAALCAGASSGLTPAAGAVWLLPSALPAGWLQMTHGDTHNCSSAQLIDMAEGHLSIAADWAARSEIDDDIAENVRWRRRLRLRCPTCSKTSAHAMLLYDTLRMWAAALSRLLASNPAALDDLHREDLVRSLVKDVSSSMYHGLTGEFLWDGRARTSPLVLQQWKNCSYFPLSTWTSGTVTLAPGDVMWRTAAGVVPDDGSERCALRALADALHVECRAAFAAVGALILAALLASLAGVAWHCRRRAEREFRARLVALDMRAIGTKLGGLDRWEVPRERVVINRKLGTGAFGTVYGGHALLAEDRGWSAVAVKTLKAGATTEEKLDFLSEAEAMKRFDHKNVVRLLGVVTKTEPVCTVMEYMLYGDLKNYLVARRHLVGCGGPAGGEVSPARLTAMALDVARALSYLAQMRYVHRDVAARNCLVSANRVVKLADFGMTRLVFENDYYRFSRKGMLPVRWMAPESLALGVFSPASDVWSFGVLLYEIITFGCLPFQGLSNAEVLARVKAGHTLDLPAGLKPQLEGLIKSCWQRERRARPKAAAVAAFLAESPRLLAPCLDVPLDALPLDAAPRDAEARWVSWAAPLSAATDSTYLSAEGRESDAFLPQHAPPPPAPSPHILSVEHEHEHEHCPLTA